MILPADSIPPHTMNRSLILFLCFALISVAVWLGMRAGDSLPATPLASVAMQPTTVKALSEGGDSAIPGGAPEATPGEAASTGTTTLAPPPPTSTPAQTTGPEMIEQWMTSTDIPAIARTIMAGFPKLEPKDHLLAASKLAPLVPDNQFDTSLKRLLTDPNTSEEARDYLYRDAINRSPEAKWPALFAVMITPGHPHAQDARESLTSDLGADFGLNQGQWLARIQEALRERNGIGK